MSLIGDRQSTGRIDRWKAKMLHILGLQPKQPKRTARISPCNKNLYELQIMKYAWKAEQGKTTNDIPTWEDLWDQFAPKWSNGPICPAGGSYTLNRVGEPPTCSIGGGGHSMAW
jgi:hypothetical protein